MDFSSLLSKEIARKKATISKALEDDDDAAYNIGASSKSKSKKKYVTKSDLTRAEQQLQEKEQEAIEKRREERTNKLKREREEELQDAQKRLKKREEYISAKKEEEARKAEEKKELETLSKLPESKLTDSELKTQLEERGISQDTIQKEKRPDWIKRLNKLIAKEEKKARISQEDTIDMEIHESDIKRDPSKVYIQLCATIRTLLSEWKNVLDKRDDTTEEAKEVLRQTIVYCKPLLSKLRSQGLGEKLFSKLAHLIMYIQQHKYRDANSIYIKMSVGNAAWPVGVTAVGIHARSARERITGENNQASGIDVAHIMSDDDTRKWIIAIKRFITFSEAHLQDKSFKGNKDEESD